MTGSLQWITLHFIPSYGMYKEVRYKISSQIQTSIIKLTDWWFIQNLRSLYMWHQSSSLDFPQEVLTYTPSLVTSRTFDSRAVLQLCSLNGFFWVKFHDFSQDLRDLRESSLLIGWEIRSHDEFWDFTPCRSHF